MNQPLDKDNLPASLNAMTFLCAAVSTAAATLAAVPYIMPSSPNGQSQIVMASPAAEAPVQATPEPAAAMPELAQPALEESKPLVLPPVETVVNEPKPKDMRAEVLASVESKPIQNADDLAQAFKSAAQLQQKKATPEASRKVAKVVAPEYAEKTEAQTKKSEPNIEKKPVKNTEKAPKVALRDELPKDSAPRGKPPVVNSKSMPLPALPKGEDTTPSGKPIPANSAVGAIVEQPQNFRPLDVAQRQAEVKSPALNTQSAKQDNSNTYTGPSVVAMSADRVWVRVGETRTAVLVVGDALAGVGKVVSINAGVVKFDNGMSKSVGDSIK